MRRRPGALVAGGLMLLASAVGLAIGAPSGVVVLLACLPFLAVLVGQPTLRRLAVRNAVRRPAESALVLLGALLGTAIITSGFLVQDSLAASVTQRAHTQLGPVDEVVRSDGVGAGRSTSALVAARPPTGIAGTLPMLTLSAPVLGTTSTPTAEPHAQVVELDFAAGRHLGGVASRTGLTGPTPRRGEAVVGADLARTLDVRVGDRVLVPIYGQRPLFRVTRILPRVGVAGFWLGQGSRSPNIFVAPGTIDDLRSQAPTGLAPPVAPTAVLAVSNGGVVEQSRARSDAVAAELRSALGGQPATVATVKADLLEVAKATAQASTSLLSVAADLSVLAGILLLVNAFVMLAQERKVSLGMLRAVGLRRAGLIAAFGLEGWLYAVVSAALGAALGVGVGRLVIFASSGQFSARSQGAATNLRFVASWASIQSGFTVGLVIALATAVATAMWIARMNVIRAVRDLPEPPPRRSGRLRLVLTGMAGFAGLGLLFAGLASHNGVLLLAGPAVFAAAGPRLLARFVPPIAAATVAAIGVIGWGLAASSVVPSAFTNAGTGLYLVQAVVLAGAGVWLFGLHQPRLASGLRGVGGGAASLPFRLGLAYPLARRSRTTLVLAIYVLEVMTLAVTLGIGNVSAGQVPTSTSELASGASVRVASDSSNPIAASAVRAIPGVAGVAALSTLNVEVAGSPGGTAAGSAVVAASDQTVFGAGAPVIGTRAAAYPTDAAAYAAVRTDPSLIIVDGKLQERFANPIPGLPTLGQQLTLRNPTTGAEHQVTIIGIQADVPVDADLVSFVARPLLAELTGTAPPTNLLFVRTDPGTNVDRLVTRINGQFAVNGADAVSFRALVAEALATRQQFFQLLGGFVAVGLLIGVIALGVVMIRAVRERRRDIGALRALGLTAAGVRRAFLAEAAFVAVQGTLIGAALGTVFAWRLSSGTSASVFAVPWSSLAVLATVTVVVSLLTAARPATLASRIPPAVALRTTE